MHILCGFLFFLFISPVHAQKYAEILMNAENGAILRQVDGDGLRYPASLTKMMTLYITFEMLKAKKITMDTHFVVPSYATHVEPCKLGLRAGEKISVRHLILGLITKSANDASVTLAVGISGSIEKFSKQMNLTARKLGMHQSRFFNPHGLPDTRQLSTAKDMALLSRALVAHFPMYYPLFKTRIFTYKGHCHSNHNKLLGQVEGLDGLKTGWFRRAGSNLAASAVRTINGKKIRLIAVVLGGTNRFARDKRIRELLEMGFSISSERLERLPPMQMMKQTPTVPLYHVRHVAKGASNTSEPSSSLLQHEDPLGDLIEDAVKEASLKKPVKKGYTQKKSNNSKRFLRPAPLVKREENEGVEISDTSKPRVKRYLKIIRKKPYDQKLRQQKNIRTKRIIRRVRKQNDMI